MDRFQAVFRPRCVLAINHFGKLNLHPSTQQMPTQTERRMLADALHQAFLVNVIAEAERDMYDEGFDSELEDEDDDTSSDSCSSTDSSSEDEVPPSTGEAILNTVAELYSQRYLATQGPINKSDATLHLILYGWKLSRPDIFRSYLRITPTCFDALVLAIQDDEVFQNNSNNTQMPVEEQVAIALYRFGHYGNAASTMKVALWAGVGFGTVPLVTGRVMKAICSDRFRRSAVRWANDEAKEIAKAWVETNSCPAWRDGWCMVDGTLVSLFMRPAFYGNNWFDRKSNYLLNVQVRVTTTACSSTCPHVLLMIDYLNS